MEQQKKEAKVSPLQPKVPFESTEAKNAFEKKIKELGLRKKDVFNEIGLMFSRGLLLDIVMWHRSNRLFTSMSDVVKEEKTKLLA